VFGVVASDVARIELEDPTPTTTTPPATTTTTAPTTTTTTVSEPVVIETTLDVASGTVVRRWGEGVKESDWDGRTAEAHVKRHDDSWEEDGIQISFPIPMAIYEDLLAGRQSVVFDFTAIVGVDYELDSDKTDGNAARLNTEFTGNRYYGWAGESLRESIGDGDNITVVHSAEFSGSWRVGAESFGIPQDIDFTLECKAKGPGGLLVSSDSQRDAEFRVDTIEVRITVE